MEKLPIYESIDMLDLLVKITSSKNQSKARNFNTKPVTCPNITMVYHTIIGGQHHILLMSGVIEDIAS